MSTGSTSTERHELTAEVKQLLDLMVHSLYSDKDIFLRELVSNASDALDKRRFESLTRPELGDAAGEPAIVLAADKDARTLSITDNGIGMSRDEVVKNIGTIARSGTKEFLAAAREAHADKVSPQLIGQFGVGFYSAFMVADRITLVTRRAGESTATAWESTGDGTYTLADAERSEPGTTVTLHLHAADPEHGLRDYASDDELARIVKRYSDFVGYPIKLGDRTLNSMKAIWDRAKSEVTDEEYQEFYRHITHDWSPPLRHIAVRIEGTFEANALLYLPSQPPFDLYSPEMKRGVQLYVRRVFVMDECKELMPPHLRFVRGVVDAHDLSLNVSREILQKDRQIAAIKKQLVRRVMGTLEEMKRDKRDEYVTWWAGFGPVLKEGLASGEGDADKLLDLVLVPSTHEAGKPTTFEEYAGRMKEGQDSIYVLAGPSPEAVARSPLLETFRAKGYEVLLFSDPIDELWLERAPTYQGKKLVSIGRGEVQLGSEDERKQAAAALEEEARKLSDLLACFRALLQDEVKEVRLSSRLTESAACLVGDAHDMTPRMHRMLEQLGHAPPPVKPILELNPSHPLVPKLQAVFAADASDPRLAVYARLLLGQAHLADSGQLPDTDSFSRSLADLMLRAV